jgi:hypothetical protein
MQKFPPTYANSYRIRHTPKETQLKKHQKKKGKHKKEKAKIVDGTYSGFHRFVCWFLKLALKALYRQERLLQLQVKKCSLVNFDIKTNGIANDQISK